VERSPREKRCVSILLALLPPAGINTPTIPNNEHNRARHIGRTLPMIVNIDKRFFR